MQTRRTLVLGQKGANNFFERYGEQVEQGGVRHGSR